MIMNQEYSLVVGINGRYQTSYFGNRDEAFSAYDDAARKVESGGLSSASLTKRHEEGWWFVIRQVQDGSSRR